MTDDADLRGRLTPVPRLRDELDGYLPLRREQLAAATVDGMSIRQTRTGGNPGIGPADETEHDEREQPGSAPRFKLKFDRSELRRPLGEDPHHAPRPAEGEPADDD